MTGLASRVVNMMWRTLMTMWRARWRVRRGKTLAASGISRIRLTTLPTDLDVLRHMNNGRYFSLFDLGRWDLMIRTGVYDALMAHGWYAVVSAETITFRRSLTPWQRFDVESRMIGHDDRAVFLEHRAVVGGEIYARAIVRARIVRRSGGTVPHEELFAVIPPTGDIGEVAPWLHAWAEASALPSSRRPAPSTWDDADPRR